ncbi:MAG: hypothetical protein K2F87_04370 [Muribaculaceae bacterium]|nr:hypothetical protein [Muribaculaceae bacterium]
MNKIKIISAIALTLALGACEKYDLPNPPGQTYPEPDGYFENSSLELNPVTETLNLPQANADNKYPVVATISKLVDFPEGYDLVVDMEVGADAQFNHYTTIATIIEGNDVTVNPDILNGAIQEAITRKPGTLDVPARFVAYATRDNTRMRLGGIDATFGQELLKVTTLEYGKVIEDAYYLIPCTASGDPEYSKAVKMENTAGEGLSGYDAPEFAIKLDVSTEGYRFAIAPQSVYTGHLNDELLGCNEAADGMSGKLVAGMPAGTVPFTGDVLVTINAEDDSYTINYAFQMLYPFSGSIKVENMMKLYTTNFINYSGVTAINKVWTLATQPDKKGLTFYQDDETEAELSEDGRTLTGNLSTTSTSPLKTPVTGNHLYWADVNLVQRTYSLTVFETISIVGAHNGWNEKEAPELTPSKDLRTWTIKDIELDGDFKFNCNHEWVYDFGGVANADVDGQHVYTLEFKGGNLSIEKGKYDVTVNFSEFPYMCTIVKK